MTSDFTGLRRAAPLGDPRLDLCDLYVFQSPDEPDRTTLILTANPEAGPLHPDAVYRIGIDNDGDLRNDIAFSFVFSEPVDGRQLVDLRLALQAEARVDAACGSEIFGNVAVSFDEPHIWRSRGGGFVFFAGARGDASFADANVIAMAVELPTSYLGAEPDVRIWARCSLRQDGKWVHADRIAHPWVSGFFTTDEDLVAFNAGEPNRDRGDWMGNLIDLMAETGGYTREEAIDAIEDEGTLPDVLTFDPSKPARYPNGRALTDDVADYRSRFLTKGQKGFSGLGAPADLLTEFPYLGPPR
ncbi:DUF4331 family protein [Mycolicibacterium gilvum]|uniref:DUF4331 family protein n=1 Tax=Mycolicibacterium gilvum TaxID=1804 RepID=UPI0040453DE3